MHFIPRAWQHSHLGFRYGGRAGNGHIRAAVVVAEARVGALAWGGYSGKGDEWRA